jgi:hypothetical protein
MFSGTPHINLTGNGGPDDQLNSFELEQQMANVSNRSRMANGGMTSNPVLVGGSVLEMPQTFQ